MEWNNFEDRILLNYLKHGTGLQGGPRMWTHDWFLRGIYTPVLQT